MRVLRGQALLAAMAVIAGGPEYDGQTGDDNVFNHPGDVFTVASGDGGYAEGATYPADSQYVTAVGGTVLTRGTLFDIATGSDGSCGAIVCSAGAGWDGPTGLGTPNGVGAFSSLAVAPPATVTALVGQSVSVTPTASGGMAPYTWADSGLPAGLSFSAATGTISGTLTTAGSHTVALKVIDNVGVPVTASFVISAQTLVITPNVIGKTFLQATTTLENAGFGAPTEVFEIDCGDPSGHVIDQNPGAGASAAPGSAVSLGVAKAPGGRGGCP